MKGKGGRRAPGQGIVGRRVTAYNCEWTIKEFYPARRGGFLYDRYIITREQDNRDWTTCVRRREFKFVRGNYTSAVPASYLGSDPT